MILFIKNLILNYKFLALFFIFFFSFFLPYNFYFLEYENLLVSYRKMYEDLNSNLNKIIDGCEKTNTFFIQNLYFEIQNQTTNNYLSEFFSTLNHFLYSLFETRRGVILYSERINPQFLQSFTFQKIETFNSFLINEKNFYYELHLKLNSLNVLINNSLNEEIILHSNAITENYRIINKNIELSCDKFIKNHYSFKKIIKL